MSVIDQLIESYEQMQGKVEENILNTKKAIKEANGTITRESLKDCYLNFIISRLDNSISEVNWKDIILHRKGKQMIWKAMYPNIFPVRFNKENDIDNELIKKNESNIDDKIIKILTGININLFN